MLELDTDRIQDHDPCAPLHLSVYDLCFKPMVSHTWLTQYRWIESLTQIPQSSIFRRVGVIGFIAMTAVSQLFDTNAVKHIAYCILLFSISYFIYENSLQGSFIWDDRAAIVSFVCFDCCCCSYFTTGEESRCTRY